MPRGEAVVTGPLTLEHFTQVRQQLPAMSHRRL